MFCQNCGANLPNESKFCTSCGSQIGTVMNTVPQKVVTDTTSEGMKPQEKEALKYKEKAKSSLIFSAIWGVICLFSLFKYNTTDSWFSHLCYGFLIFCFGLALILQVVSWHSNKSEYEKYENMSDQEWRDEKVRQEKLANDMTTHITKGVVQGIIKSLFG